MRDGIWWFNCSCGSTLTYFTEFAEAKYRLVSNGTNSKAGIIERRKRENELVLKKYGIQPKSK